MEYKLQPSKNLFILYRLSTVLEIKKTKLSKTTYIIAVNSSILIQGKKQEMGESSNAINAAHYSTGKVAAGFTSTVMEPITRHEAAVVDEDTLRYVCICAENFWFSCGLANIG